MFEDSAELAIHHPQEARNKDLAGILWKIRDPLSNRFKKDEVLVLLDNKIRGVSDKKTGKFSDLTRAKIDRLEDLLKMVKSEERFEESLDILWQIATSYEPGFDISWKAYELLRSLPSLPKSFENKLIAVLEGEADSKTICFATELIRGRGTIDLADYSQVIREKIEGFGLYADYWNPDYINKIIIDRAVIFTGDEYTYAYLVLKRYLEEELAQTDHLPDPIEALMKGTREVSKRIDRAAKYYEKFKLKRSLLTEGSEIQGTRPQNVPIILETESLIYSSLSPKDYSQLMYSGQFIPSRDRLWELALPPSSNSILQARIIHELSKSTHIPLEQEPICLDITLGLLKTSEKYREAAALQLIMMAAGYLVDPKRLKSSYARSEWFREAGKRALRARSPGELEKTKEGEVQEAAEMRITHMTNLYYTYKALLTLPTLGSAALEHQKKIDYLSFSPELSDHWDNFIIKINEVFAEYSLPSVIKMWNFRELDNLRKVLEDKNGELFSHKIRDVIAEYRLKITPVLEKEDVPLEVIERIEGKSLGVLHQTVNKWKEKYREKFNSLLFKHREHFEVPLDLRRLALVAPYIAIVEKVASGIPPGEIVDNISLYPFLLYLIVNPDVLTQIPTTIKSVLKGRPTFEVRKAIQDLNSLILGSGSMLFFTAYATSPGKKEAMIASLACLGISHVGRKLLKPREPIEQYVLSST